MKRIYIDRDLCEACKGCVLACMAKSNNTDIDSLNLSDTTNQSANLVKQSNQGELSPLFCRHCDDPECVEACMSGALTKDKESAIVSLDQDRCAGCWMCVMSCSYGMIKKDTQTNVAFKCDLCKDKEETACVENCPMGAIELIEVGEGRV
jgi:carbon-monoxide dehydrogenase iron sulfur subunit